MTEITTIQSYSDAAWSTAIYPNAGTNLFYTFNGMRGEAGELHEQAKKLVRDDGLKDKITVSPERYQETYGKLPRDEDNIDIRTLRELFLRGTVMRELYPERTVKLRDEAGDLLWYINATAREMFGPAGLTRICRIALDHVAPWRLAQYLCRYDMNSMLHDKFRARSARMAGGDWQEVRPACLDSLIVLQDGPLSILTSAFNRLDHTHADPYASAFNVVLAEVSGADGLGAFNSHIGFSTACEKLSRTITLHGAGYQGGYMVEYPVGIAYENALAYMIYHLRDLLFMCGITMQETMQTNVDKLLSRKDRGVLQGSGSNR